MMPQNLKLESNHYKTIKKIEFLKVKKKKIRFFLKYLKKNY
jgi:hypothetical protein